LHFGGLVENMKTDANIGYGISFRKLSSKKKQKKKK
jgi:hypothetical protein